MKRIALCIPTYEAEECVRDMLESCAPYYLQHGIDFIFYDSSRNDKTEKLIREKQNEFGSRLRYNRSDMHPNEKAYQIYRGNGYQQEDYDYVWLCSDAVQFTGSAIGKIEKILDEGYDVIVNDPYDDEGVGSKEYTDANSLFQECVWGRGGATLFGATVLKVETMLQGVVWENYDKFLDWDIINYSHISFIFNRLLEMPGFRGYHLALENREYRSSVYKKTSTWYYYAFSIICGPYVKAIENLPAEYKPKRDVIRKNGEAYGLGRIRRFVEFRAENVFNIQVFIKYFKQWKKVSPIHRLRLGIIAVTPQAVCKRICYKDKKILLKQFWEFYQKHDRIFIYGAGRVGTIYSKYFEKENISFQGFCVSDAQGRTTYLKYPLFSVDEIDFASQTGAIIALQEENAKDVLKLLRGKGICEDHIFYSPDFYKLISFELGYRD